jgi:hypothetical protein
MRTSVLSICRQKTFKYGLNNLRQSICNILKRLVLSRQLSPLLSSRRCKREVGSAETSVNLYQLQGITGSGSVNGLATGYGLDGQGIESRWGRDFPHLSRPALEPT